MRAIVADPAILFDARARAYDALIDWPRRLAAEAPFYRALFARAGVRSVLDAACGTGRHAAMFHSWNLRVEGADVSPAMVAECRRQFGEPDGLRWVVRSFTEPHPAPGSLDAVVCVGNSLALVADPAAVRHGLREMLAAVRPGGVGVFQVLNLWALPDGPCVWQKCRRVVLEGAEHLLAKGVHRAGGRGYVELVDVALAGGGAEPACDAAEFLGLEAEELSAAARAAGAARVAFYGDYRQSPYRREQSPDLIVVAKR